MANTNGANDLTWIGGLANGRALSIEMARAINELLHKRVDPQTAKLPKTAFDDVADTMKLSKQTVQFMFYELRRAFTGCNGAQTAYNNLDEYWNAGRPYKNVQSAKNKRPRSNGKQRVVSMR